MPKYKVYNFTEKRESIFTMENPFTGAIGEAFEEFLHYYSPDLIAPPALQKPKLAKPQDRVCRFCFKREPDVTFHNEAHVLPHLIGNRYLIHDSECDLCNDRFKVYEDSFSKSLGMLRTADVIRGKNGVPGFKSDDGALSMRLEKTEAGKHFIDIRDYRNGTHRIDERTVLLKAVKQTYIPLHVMKSLFKTGYCLLHPAELPAYTPTLRIVAGTEFDNKLNNFAQVAKFTLPVILERPFVVTYKKKEAHTKENMPTKVVTLSFGRFVYQYFLVNADDSFMFEEGVQCTFRQIPPYFNGDQNSLIAEKVDFSSPEKRVGEEHSMILTFDHIHTKP